MIRILVRDINGKKADIFFATWGSAYAYAHALAQSDLDNELLAVLYRNGTDKDNWVCVYSALGSSEPLSWEDLAGFLA